MTTHITVIDNEYELLVDHPVVLIRRNGKIMVDERGSPINYWLVDAANEAIAGIRALDELLRAT